MLEPNSGIVRDEQKNEFPRPANVPLPPETGSVEDLAGLSRLYKETSPGVWAEVQPGESDWYDFANKEKLEQLAEEALAALGIAAGIVGVAVAANAITKTSILSRLTGLHIDRRNVVKYSLASALGMAIAAKSLGHALAYGCYWFTKFYECRYSSSCCGTGCCCSTWAWQEYACCTPQCVPNGQGRYVRLYCGC